MYGWGLSWALCSVGRLPDLDHQSSQNDELETLLFGISPVFFFRTLEVQVAFLFQIPGPEKPLSGSFKGFGPIFSAV